ncbi:hypothetical protein ASD67_02370 [Sphingopyxis sp. Root1497]|nr:hypothetical protein ASD67_02370 [Sphingopyxis sp. Root1497]
MLGKLLPPCVSVHICDTCAKQVDRKIDLDRCVGCKMIRRTLVPEGLLCASMSGVRQFHS